jgi:6-phosphofructokinase 1
LLAFIRQEKIDAVVSIVDAQALAILFKLHRKGLPTVCVPKSAQNQVAATQLSFGFNSALSFTVELLDRARQAAQSARRIGVVEVIGEHAGWLALQSATAACADAVLLPELPYDLKKVAAKLREKLQAGRCYGLVVVAEGAKPAAGAPRTLRQPIHEGSPPGARGRKART